MNIHQIIRFFALVVLIFPAKLHVTSDIVDDFRQICPYTDLCTLEGRRSNMTALQDMRPCCMDCFCDKACWEFNDCCVDVQHTTSTLPRRTQCRFPVVNNNAFQLLDDQLKKRRFPLYRMIDGCPGNFTGSQVILEKCIEAFSGVPNFDDLVMVSRLDQPDEVYKNKYCAMCNGVEDVIKWELYASQCAEKVNSDSGAGATESFRRMWQTCYFYSTPPTTLQLSRPLLDCSDEHLISVCEPLGETVKAQWKKECEEGFYSPVYLEKLFYMEVYKNPFCLLCNNGANASREMCNADLFSLGSRVTGFGTMSMLLSGSPDSDKLIGPDIVGDENGCAETEIFDNVSNQCRKLYCPFNFAVFYGKCMKLSTSISNALVSMELLFRPVRPVFISETINQLEDAEGFSASFLDLLRFGRCRPSSMYGHVFTVPSNGSIRFLTMKVSFILSNSCSLDYVTNSTMHLAMNPVVMDIPINRQPIRMEGRLHFAEPLYPVLPTSQLKVYDSSLLVYMNTPRTNPFEIRQVFVCPSFTFSLTEYNSLLAPFDEANMYISEFENTTRLKRGFFVLSNRTVAACTDTYFGLYRNAALSTNVSAVFTCTVMILLMMLLH